MMDLPRITSREEWLEARERLLAKEKEATRVRDELHAERQALPMVEVEKDYVFEGPDGKASLLDMFEGRRQLIVQHFMFDPEWEDGCPSCTYFSEDLGHLPHLHEKDTSFAVISRAPLQRIEAYRRKKGWTFPWYSSFGSDFNYDFHVTLDESVATVEYNFQPIDDQDEQSAEVPGRSSFLREGDSVFHTYSVYARGLETVGGSYYFLDETALGRQEDWEEPKGRAADARGAVPDFSS